MLANVKDVAVKDISVKNSPDWTLHFASVTNLHVNNVHVHNPQGAPNSDGIDLDCVQNAVIENSFFDVGDDALCVKSGIDYFGRKYGRPSKNIIFRNISVGNGHGISIGSESSGGVYNITFEDIRMSGTNRGPRIKSERGRGGTVSDITYRNISAKNLEAMISLTLNYASGLKPTNESATPRLKNILIENCQFIGGNNGGEFNGLNESHIQNVTLRDVDFNGGKVSFSTCSYVDSGKCEGSTNACPPCFVKD